MGSDGKEVAVIIDLKYLKISISGMILWWDILQDTNIFFMHLRAYVTRLWKLATVHCMSALERMDSSFLNLVLKLNVIGFCMGDLKRQSESTSLKEVFCPLFLSG